MIAEKNFEHPGEANSRYITFNPCPSIFIRTKVAVQQAAVQRQRDRDDPDIAATTIPAVGVGFDDARPACGAHARLNRGDCKESRTDCRQFLFGTIHRSLEQGG